MGNSWQPCYLNSAHTWGGFVFRDAVVKPQCHLTEWSPVELKSSLVCSGEFQTCAHLKKKKSPRNFLSLPLRPGKTRAYHEIVVLGLPRERNAPCAKSICCWLIPQEDLPFLVSLELSGCCSEAEPAPRFTLPLYQAVGKMDNIQRWSSMARMVALRLVQGTVYMFL